MSVTLFNDFQKKIIVSEGYVYRRQQYDLSMLSPLCKLGIFKRRYPSFHSPFILTEYGLRLKKKFETDGVV